MTGKQEVGIVFERLEKMYKEIGRRKYKKKCVLKFQSIIKLYYYFGIRFILSDDIIFEYGELQCKHMCVTNMSGLRKLCACLPQLIYQVHV